MRRAIILLILFCLALCGQMANLSNRTIEGNPILTTGTGPQKFFGTTAPGTVTGNLPGDLYSDTTAHQIYQCNAPSGTVAPACTTVSAGGWTLLNGAGGGPEYRYMVAARCQNTVAGAGFSTPVLTDAPTPTCVTGSNVLTAVLQFLDSGTETVQDHWSYMGAVSQIDLLIKWRTAATSGSVVWQLATVCVADGETIDPAWNAAQTVTDAAKGTTLQLNDAVIANVTTTGCATSEEFFWKFFRDPTHGSDNLNATAELVSLTWTITR